MKKLLSGMILVVSFLCVGCSTGQTSNQNDPPRQIMSNGDELAMLQDVENAVVGISVAYDDGYAIGSGVAVIDGSLILTNNHVVAGGDDITLYFADETMAGAQVLWSDENLDIAILKSERAIPYLAFGSSENVSLGEPVYAVGTPLTLQFKHTFTKGIVSAKDRVVGVESSSGGDVFMQSLIQHDASINPGNSGGPLINAQGQIVGINTLKASSGEGIGFAIPVEIGQKLATRISQDEDFEMAYIGIFGFDSEIAKVYGYDLDQKGVFVISTTGPSERVLQKGDLIVSVGGQKIEKMLDLRLAMFDFEVGQELQIDYIRNGQQYSCKVILQAR